MLICSIQPTRKVSIIETHSSRFIYGKQLTSVFGHSPAVQESWEVSLGRLHQRVNGSVACLLYYRKAALLPAPFLVVALVWH